MLCTKQGRSLVALITVVFNLMAFTAHADDVFVFDVRKTLPLEPSEPVYHDYYISAGPEAGLRKGMYVSVVRQMPIHDPVQNKAQAQLNVEVARVHIIHVEKNLSVARLDAGFGSADRPLLEFPAIMIGDQVDMKTATMKAPKADGSMLNPNLLPASDTAQTKDTPEPQAAPLQKTHPLLPPASLPTLDMVQEAIQAEREPLSVLAGSL